MYDSIYKNIYFLTLKTLERLKFDIMVEIGASDNDFQSIYMYDNNDKFSDKFEFEFHVDFIKEWKNNKSRHLEISVQPYFGSVKEGLEVCMSLWDCVIDGNFIKIGNEFVNITRPISSGELNIIKTHNFGTIRFEKSIKNKGNLMVIKLDSFKLTNMIDALLLYGTVYNTSIIKN